MLRRLIHFSILHQGVTITLAILLTLYGLYATSRSKVDIFPEFAPPQIVVFTNAPGLSPEEVEQLVTRPIETAINGAPNLKTLRSQSIQGISFVTAIFNEQTQIMLARQVVGERLAEVASKLPRGIKAPIMEPLTSAMSLVLMAGITSQTRTLKDLRSLADWTLLPRLLAVPGVAKVVIYGGEVREFQIELLPDLMKAFGISFDEILAGASQATGIRGSGFIETKNQRIILRSEGQSLTAEKLENIVIRRTPGLSVRIKDVARVVDGFAPKIGDAQILGQSGIILAISSQYGANTLQVAEAVKKKFNDLGPLLQAEQVSLKPDLFQPAEFIQKGISNVKSSLLLGAILVVSVLFIFLWNLRISFISATAIPLSLLIAIVLLDYIGISLNTMTLGGLAIALGEVVDDAIIDVENIFRRLKENAKLNVPKQRLKVILNASIEVRSAVVFATFVVIVVFLPVINLSGIQGKLFAPLGYAYIFSILASLLVALTLTPALSSLLLGAKTLRHEEPTAVSWLKKVYQLHLERILAKPKHMIIIAVTLVLASLATIPFFGGAFLPDFQEGRLIIHMALLPGTSLSESQRFGKLITKELLKLTEIHSISQITGTAEASDDTLGTFESEFQVELKPDQIENTEAVQGKIRQVLAKFPGASFAMNTFLTERIEETISGSTAPVVVHIFGDDLKILDQKSKEVARLLAHISGATDVRMEARPTIPEVHISLKPERLTSLGFEPDLVLNAIQTAYQGSPVSEVYQGNRVTQIVALLDAHVRADPEQIASLPIRNTEGRWVELGELADIREDSGRYSILHENTSRRALVSCNVIGRDVTSFTKELEIRLLREVTLPNNMYTIVSGAAVARSQASHEILVQALLAGGIIILLLWIVFQSARNLILVLINLPFAFVGGLLAVFCTGGWLSLGSLIGFVSLFGITTRNSIMLISHYKHLVQKENASWDIRTAIRGATERLLPILMTATVTGLGLLPLAIGSGASGREIEGPMAIVILGGLLSSTILNLLMLPALALRYGQFDKPKSRVSSACTQAK